ncbi:MAG TPA: COR domain-containing protein, partial [Candidatus Angelobacter sp.]|nr:COR domain-containing protein [Candidatus Angelobacter sp.]
EKYGGNIKGFVATDCDDKKSITQLKRKIVEELQAMESLKARFPRRWFAIKDALSQMKAEHISFEDYRTLCQKNGESDPASQTSLAGFLHDLGIALNYGLGNRGQDQRLRFNYVLKPEWVTQGIYALLHAFVRKKGVFTRAEAVSELAKKDYSPEDTHFILELMELFELSFPLDDRHNRVLIPELLADQQPKDAASFKPAECLNFGYKYPVLTEGLLPRFIARTHHLGRAETRWKSGVILKDPSTGCSALVRADAAEAEVRVHIDGPQEGRRELLGIIRFNFDVIHSDYEFKPEAQVYPPAAPQKALAVDELEALARSKATTVSVVLPDKTVIDQDIATLIDPLATRPPLKLFLSYSHQDENFINELRKDLKLMQMNGLVYPWHDRNITAGEQWEPSILEELNAADMVICQLSRNYFASDYCIAELKAAIQRKLAGEAELVAYVLTDCGWKEFPGLSKFQLLPTDGKPLSDWNDSNKYWRAVIEGIQKAVKKFQAERKIRPARGTLDM